MVKDFVNMTLADWPGTFLLYRIIKTSFIFKTCLIVGYKNTEFEKSNRLD